MRLLPEHPIRRTMYVLIPTVLAMGVAFAVLAWESHPRRVGDVGRSYGLPRTTVDMTVLPDGWVQVREDISFDFTGYFSGAFRDIPMRKDDRIDRVAVCEPPGSGAFEYQPPPLPDLSTLPPATAQRVREDYYRAYPDALEAANGEQRCPEGFVRYAGGGATALGSSDGTSKAGTVVLRNPDDSGPHITNVTRLVWHYSANDQLRTFTVVYRAHGWLRHPKGSDEVVLSAIPWGSEWKGTLRSLHTTVHLPPGIGVLPKSVYAAGSGAGHVTARRVRVPGTNDRDVIILRGSDLAPGNRAELLAVLPAKTVTSGNLPVEDATLATIRHDAEQASRATRSRTDTWTSLQEHGGTWIVLSGLIGLVLAVSWLLIAMRLWLGEERWPDGEPRLRSEPPSDLPPALAVSLVEQRETYAPTALVATVFDLVRRKLWQVLPANGSNAGVQVDIALKTPRSRPDTTQLPKFEQSAVQLVDEIVEGQGDGVPLGEFRSRLKGDLKLSKVVSGENVTFDRRVNDAIERHSWFSTAAIGTVAWPRRALFIILALCALVISGLPADWGLLPADNRVAAGIAAILLPGLVGAWVVLRIASSDRLLRLRWTTAGRTEAAQWTAYRDYLDRYGDMADEQTASIELWERHLVYAIAFGCADDILHSVRPGSTMTGGSELSMASMNYGMLTGFTSGLSARAYDPAEHVSSSSSSGSSSFGGGSSFSGGGGGGGGGGGAW